MVSWLKYKSLKYEKFKETNMYCKGQSIIAVILLVQIKNSNMSFNPGYYRKIMSIHTQVTVWNIIKLQGDTIKQLFENSTMINA